MLCDLAEMTGLSAGFPSGSERSRLRPGTQQVSIQLTLRASCIIFCAPSVMRKGFLPLGSHTTYVVENIRDTALLEDNYQKDRANKLQTKSQDEKSTSCDGASSAPSFIRHPGQGISRT